jgi:polyferredoxin
MAIVGAVMLYALGARSRFTVSVLHDNTPMFVTLSDGRIRNAYTLRFGNKWGTARDFDVTISGLDGLNIESAEASLTPSGALRVKVEPDSTLPIRVFASAPRASLREKSSTIAVVAIDPLNGETVRVRDQFFSP